MRKFPSGAPGRAALLSIASAFAATAHADNVNVDAVLFSRLAPQIATIYQAKFGQAVAPGTAAAVSFKGTLVPQGLQFTMPSTFPKTPLVLQENVYTNCNDQVSTGHMTVNQSTTRTQSWSTTDTVSAEVSVTVSYESPIGFGGDASATAGYSHEWNQGGEKSDSVGWETGQDVPVSPGKQVTAQFVVDQETLDIPYHVDFVASGATDIAYTIAAEPEPVVTWTGSSANAVVGGNEADGTKLYVCKASYRGGEHAGKVVHGKCSFGYGGKEVLRDSGDFEYLSAKSSQVHWVDNIGTRAISAGKENGEDRYVCRVEAHGGIHPGKVVGGYCHYGYGGREESSQTFKSLNTYAPKAAHVQLAHLNLEDYLPAAAQRTITLRGVYRGVTAVQGSFRVGSPVTMQCASLLATSAAPAMAPGAAAPAAATPAVAVRSGAPAHTAVPLPVSAIVGAPVKPKVGKGGGH